MCPLQRPNIAQLWHFTQAAQRLIALTPEGCISIIVLVGWYSVVHSHYVAQKWEDA